uniref:Ribonuclease 3 n=1 Tax=Strigamia maritima TaxID=126957 RepID=T1IMV5_STRMM
MQNNWPVPTTDSAEHQSPNEINPSHPPFMPPNINPISSFTSYQYYATNNQHNNNQMCYNNPFPFPYNPPPQIPPFMPPWNENPQNYNYYSQPPPPPPPWNNLPPNPNNTYQTSSQYQYSQLPTNNVPHMNRELQNTPVTNASYSSDKPSRSNWVDSRHNHNWRDKDHHKKRWPESQSRRDSSPSRNSSDRYHSRSSSRVRRRSRSPRRSPKRESHSRRKEKSRSRSHSPERKSRDVAKSREISSNTNNEKNIKVASEDKVEEIDLDTQLEKETSIWTRCSPADLYYQRSDDNPKIMIATPKLIAIHERFDNELIQKFKKAQEKKPDQPTTETKQKLRTPKSPTHSSDSSDAETSTDDEDDNALIELKRKQQHPDRLDKELWYNDPGEMNDGPLCRCSARASRTGIRHGIYPGEGRLQTCNALSNNADRLYHYRITMSPHTNFLTKTPTIIKHDGHEFIFEGFSLLSHYKLSKLPTCKVIRFNIEYTILYIEETFLENCTVRCLELFNDYLFTHILELVDLDLKAYDDHDGCNRFHLMPRFVRALEDNGKEILSMNNVLLYLLNSFRLLVEETELATQLKMNQYEWQNFADEVKGMKPCSIRVDQLDRDQTSKDVISYPVIVHFGIRPLQLSYAGNPNYQKAWRDYVKYRHLLANKPKVTYQDRHKLTQKEMRLQEMRTKSNLKRDVTVVVNSQGFYRTGVMCDIVQHAMLVPVLICHLRFHKSLDLLEENIGHTFTDRYLLQLALTHPSYRENFGTNPDHARNSLTNCGIRQPEYGDRRIHYMNTRKRGINTLINIMSRFGKNEETVSNINHNERLEFLGDAVVEFLTSIHLYHLFPDIEEGGLATYRAAIVQNQHLAVLAKKLHLDEFMLYAHGSDLCHDLELRHAMANCLEALMGALFLDGEIEAADKVFSRTLFSEFDLLDIWINYPPHPLQEQEPEGDRKYIESVPLLQKLTQFEGAIGVDFTHVRLLARAFTHRSVGYNNLTLGSNQRLEFLGDTVLQLVASEYLYKHFPEHHEGHLSLLRSSLVNNRTQAVVCDDLGMVDYAIYAYPKGELKTKDRADLLEAFLGALYVDKNLEYCKVFCQVCFFPRLQDFIMNQDWNDPKSKLQQCCLTLRTMDGGEPDIPVYKVIECKGPTNTRIFTVAVYFRGERLAKGSGHSIQQAEMAAASKALECSKDRYQVKYSTNPLFVLISKQNL